MINRMKAENDTVENSHYMTKVENQDHQAEFFWSQYGNPFHNGSKRERYATWQALTAKIKNLLFLNR